MGVSLGKGGVYTSCEILFWDIVFQGTINFTTSHSGTVTLFFCGHLARILLGISVSGTRTVYFPVLVCTFFPGLSKYKDCHALNLMFFHPFHGNRLPG